MIWKPKHIWFFCPACDEKLVVDAADAGQRADCPECGKNIPIPQRSTATPAWLKQAGVYAAHATVIALAAVAGWWWSESARVPAPVADVASAGAAVAPAEAKSNLPSDPAKGESRDVNQELLREHTDLKGRYDKMLQWMMENYRGKYPLAERLVSSLRIEPMTGTGEINPDLVEMLKLNDEEKALVQDVMTYVQASLKQAERQRARVTEQTNLRITYEVPTFVEEGASLKEDLYLGLEAAIGAARFDRMVDVAGTALREKMHYFGEASRTLTFEVIMPPYEGAHPPYVLIRDGWMIPEGDSVRLTKVQETAVMDLPESYRPYADWLPEEISRYTVQ